MSVKISELPLLSDLADNDVLAGVDTSANATKKIELATLKDYIDTNTTYTAGTNIDITNNVVSAPNVYNKDEMDSQIEELQSEVDSLNTIYNAFPTASGEGESVSLDGTAETKFKRIDLKGNTSQNGTPTPDTPIPVNVVSGDNSVVVIGKNLWDEQWEQGYIDGSGTLVTNSASIRSKNFIPVQPNTTYYGHYSESGGRWTYYNKNKQWIGTSTNLNSSKTTPNDCYFLKISTTTSYGGTYLNDIAIYNENITSYFPYNGNTYPINLPVENLLDFDSFLTSGSATYTLSNGIYNITDKGTTTQKKEITLQHNTTYTISQIVQSQSTTNLRLEVFEGDTIIATSYTTNSSSTTATFTTGASGTYYIRINYSAITYPIIINKPIIEKGTKINGYSPYGTTPIELCKIPNTDYEDTFIHDKTLDKWYWHREVGEYTMQGTESFSNTSSRTNTYRLVYQISGKKPNSTNISTFYSNRGQGVPDAYWSTDEVGICEIRNANSRGMIFSLPINIVYDGDTARTWFKNNETKIYYILETLTNTEITYQPLIEQLNNLEKAMSYNGQTNISQVNNDLPFIISAEAIMSLQNVLDRIELLES